jgi:5-methylthioadenosine/S-adenosylhomocysteine deaminase
LKTLWKAAWTWRDGALREGGSVLVDDATGRILESGTPDRTESHPGSVLVPGLVSAHSHCFQVLLRGWADHPRDFKDWVSRCLYPLVLALDEKDLEAAALLCFSEMLRSGITTVGEFHYVHNDADGRLRGNDLDELVVRAARKAGIRIALLRTLYDTRAREGQKRFAEAPRDAARRTVELARTFKEDPQVSVLPAPHSLHGASEEAIREGATAAKQLGSKWHIHLAEQEDDVAFAKERFGKSPLRVLDGWGLLDERTVVVHGIWLDDGERALLAERKGALVSCPLTSLSLGDGVLDLPDLVKRGVLVGLGTDMNAAPCIFSEMRAAEAIQRARLHRMGVLPAPRKLFELGTKDGARTLGVSTGSLAPGEPFDAVLLDLADPSLAPASALGGDALLAAIVSSMRPASAVKTVLVAGKTVVKDGQLVSAEAREAPARLARGAWRRVASRD